MLPAKKLLGADGRVYCPHCEETVGKRTCWRHKRLYYNSSTDQWQTDHERERISDDSDEESFQFSPNNLSQSYLNLWYRLYKWMLLCNGIIICALSILLLSGLCEASRVAFCALYVLSRCVIFRQYTCQDVSSFGRGFRKHT